MAKRKRNKSESADTRRIKLWISTGFAGAKHVSYENLPDDWDDMTEKEQQEYLDEESIAYMQNCIEFGAYVVDDETEGE